MAGMRKAVSGAIKSGIKRGVGKALGTKNATRVVGGAKKAATNAAAKVSNRNLKKLSPSGSALVKQSSIVKSNGVKAGLYNNRKKIAGAAAAAGVAAGGAAAYKNRDKIKAGATSAKQKASAGVSRAKKEASYVAAGAKNVYQSGKARTKVSNAVSTAKRKTQEGYKVVFGKLRRVAQGR